MSIIKPWQGNDLAKMLKEAHKTAEEGLRMAKELQKNRVADECKCELAASCQARDSHLLLAHKHNKRARTWLRRYIKVTGTILGKECQILLREGEMNEPLYGVECERETINQYVNPQDYVESEEEDGK